VTSRRRFEARAAIALVAKDLTAIRRSKAVVIPMLGLPFILMVLVPIGIGLAARGPRSPDVSSLLRVVPHGLVKPILRLPKRERLVVLVNGYLLAPLFLIAPLMVASVLAADTFAGEKDRRTLEGLLHLPIGDRELFYGKVAGALLPTVAVSWVGFVLFSIVANVIAWPVMHRVFVPTTRWAVLIFWVTPAVAAFGLGAIVRVSARARTAPEANQLSAAVVLPLIFTTWVQATGLLLVAVPVAVGVGAGVWVLAGVLLSRGARRFTRDRLAAAV
jgi:ABC-type transport system involved in multi-copper enzyme maturation permease subunit